MRSFLRVSANLIPDADSLTDRSPSTHVDEATDSVVTESILGQVRVNLGGGVSASWNMGEKPLRDIADWGVVSSEIPGLSYYVLPDDPNYYGFAGLHNRFNFTGPWLRSGDANASCLVVAGANDSTVPFVIGGGVNNRALNDGSDGDAQSTPTAGLEVSSSNESNSSTGASTACRPVLAPQMAFAVKIPQDFHFASNGESWTVRAGNRFSPFQTRSYKFLNTTSSAPKILDAAPALSGNNSAGHAMAAPLAISNPDVATSLDASVPGSLISYPYEYAAVATTFVPSAEEDYLSLGTVRGANVLNHNKDCSRYFPTSPATHHPIHFWF